MGKKINPTIFRVVLNKSWKSKWFARKLDYAKTLEEDQTIRKFLQKELENGGIHEIEILRSNNQLEIILHTTRPGVVIGRGGSRSEELKKQLQKMIGSNKVLQLTIKEVVKANLSPNVVLQNMVEQLKKRIPFRRVMKQGIDQIMKAGAEGAKIIMSGRLNGVEIARTETVKQGRMPLHTLRADIDYSRGAANTIWGKIGIKVWIYKGEIFNKQI